jgi:4a-hydroxytetrahydrobiopterin dehydratase
MAKLSEAELRTLLANLDGWTVLGDAIHKTYTFRGFHGAIAFVNRLAERANAAGHHPDLEIHYNRVVVSLSTHDEGGVTEKDAALAAEIDEAAGVDAAAERGAGASGAAETDPGPAVG